METGVSIVVSTIGNPEGLASLLESLPAAVCEVPAEVIVVDQSADRVCQGVVDQWSGRVPVRLTTSDRGVCLGRNVGARLAVGGVLTFPDDNCLYDPGSISAAWTLMQNHPEWGAVSGIQLTSEGRPSMLRWAPSARTVTPWNIHRTMIESALFIRRSVFEELGEFDEALGAGSSGPYQAGEGADLIMRALENGYRVEYDPSFNVHQDDPRDEIDDRYAVKMRGYGAGFGLVHRRHRMPVSLFAWFMARKAVGAGVRVVRGRRDLAKADVTFMRAAVAGYRDGASSARR